MDQTLNILIADDNPSDRMLLEAMLSQFGHNVITAVDGQEAVEMFDPNRIQLVCLDVKMPRKDGWEAAVEIQKIAGSSFVAIVFLSGVTDPVALSNCLKVGGTDFISKPYSPTLVTAKLKAIARLLLLHKKLSKQHNELSLFSQKMVQDQEVAKMVYEQITRSNSLNDPCLKTLHRASQIFNGDVILAAYKPNGGMHLLLGDFTGHGLSAAIGALPLADIFFEWTEKGFLMKQILPEINKRLYSVLPSNMFCSAAFIDINIYNESVEIWNGGLPDLLLFRENDRLPRLFKSMCLPLGVADEYEFECVTDIVSFRSSDVLLAFSDGVYEAKGAGDRVMFNDALSPLYDGDVEHGRQFEWLEKTLYEKGIIDNPHDDLSCLAIELNREKGFISNQAGYLKQHTRVPASFSFEYALDAESLRSTDPLPYVLQILTTVPGLNEHSSQIFMILSEMYSNALEHGVLKLSSFSKQTVEGFEYYYSERKERLSSLDTGTVTIKAKVNSTSERGMLELSVEDSGEGFDVSQSNQELEWIDTPYSRGIPLLKQLCEQVEFSEKGNFLKVVYSW
ncbi:fused response regulator/phosphatase [Marinomonas balearica]|uniref:Histidine kinase-like protein n=1 Tax=Marinomonas balearica TaxID=491947 RepID=A0A4R6MB16_9GAMM|nr:fused response regulator/phosphatase [Marinomonas balearica]TDO98295.1 histidine kinase-like protein [Marinomonas balearica]